MIIEEKDRLFSLEELVKSIPDVVNVDGKTYMLIMLREALGFSARYVETRFSGVDMHEELLVESILVSGYGKDMYSAVCEVKRKIGERL